MYYPGTFSDFLCCSHCYSDYPLHQHCLQELFSSDDIQAAENKNYPDQKFLIKPCNVGILRSVFQKLVLVAQVAFSWHFWRLRFVLNYPWRYLAELHCFLISQFTQSLSANLTVMWDDQKTVSQRIASSSPQGCRQLFQGFPQQILKV